MAPTSRTTGVCVRRSTGRSRLPVVCVCVRVTLSGTPTVAFLPSVDGVAMSTETRQQTGLAVDGAWKAGVVAGLAGGVAMSIVMLAMGAMPVIAAAIPGLYTLAPPANPAAGLVVHLSHAAVLGVAFAGVVGAVGVEEPRLTVLVGLGYGVVTWVVLAALVMPVWLAAVGFPNAPPFPNFAVPSLLWHLVYGAVAGAVFPAVRG